MTCCHRVTLHAVIKIKLDLFDEVRDMEISDMSAFAHVLSYFEEINEETECFMQMLGNKFDNATITWEQPLYQQSNRLTRTLKDPDNFDKLTYKTGPMTKDEVELIEENWHKFMERFNIPDKLICLARWKNKELNQYLPQEKARIYTIAYLARGLERTLHQVYQHIVTYYGGCNRGQYTEDEKKVIDICFHHCPKNAAVILSAVLARQPRGIYKRIHFATNGKPPKHKIRWNLELVSKFVKLLMKYTGEPLEGLKNKKIDKSVWLKLQNDFDKQYEYLQYIWNVILHCQLFVKCTFTLRQLKRKVFKV
ncbi:hypothetical protein evm_004243 [Chilo suppressalis]|nr:hypothetical protein evm_004243 [Chilo suppressalis]